MSKHLCTECSKKAKGIPVMKTLDGTIIYVCTTCYVNLNYALYLG